MYSRIGLPLRFPGESQPAAQPPLASGRALANHHVRGPTSAAHFEPMLSSSSGATKTGGMRWVARSCERRDVDGVEITHQLLLGDLLVFEHVLSATNSTSAGPMYDTVSVWRCEHPGRAAYTAATPRVSLNSRPAGTVSARTQASSTMIPVESSVAKDELRALIAACALREDMAPAAFAQELPDDFATLLRTAQLV
jgi:hypothetical protein